MAMPNVQLKAEDVALEAWQGPAPIALPQIPEKLETRQLDMQEYWRQQIGNKQVDQEVLEDNQMTYTILKEIEHTPDMWNALRPTPSDYASIAAGVYSRTGKVLNIVTIRKVFLSAKEKLKQRIKRVLYTQGILSPKDLEDVLWRNYGVEYGVFRFFRQQTQSLEWKWRCKLSNGQSLDLTVDSENEVEEENETPLYSKVQAKRSGGPLTSGSAPKKVIKYVNRPNAHMVRHHGESFGRERKPMHIINTNPVPVSIPPPIGQNKPQNHNTLVQMLDADFDNVNKPEVPNFAGENIPAANSQVNQLSQQHLQQLQQQVQQQLRQLQQQQQQLQQEQKQLINSKSILSSITNESARFIHAHPEKMHQLHHVLMHHLYVLGKSGSDRLLSDVSAELTDRLKVFEGVVLPPP